jgi:hypothetical protein
LLYPNPANNEINIVLPLNETVQIEIANSLGRTVRIENKRNNIDVSSLPKGIYLIRITREQRTYFKKLIRN